MHDRNAPNEAPDSPLCTGDPLARALAVLEPMPTNLNRDALMFAAGSGRRDREVAFWKRVVLSQATAFCFLIGFGLTSDVFGNRSSTPNPGPNRTSDIASAPSAPKAAAAPDNLARIPDEPDTTDYAKQLKYLQLRADVLAVGIDALPKANSSSSAVDIGKLEDSLQMPRGTFASYGLAPKPKRTEPEE